MLQEQQKGDGEFGASQVVCSVAFPKDLIKRNGRQGTCVGGKRLVPSQFALPMYKLMSSKKEVDQYSARRV